jgi:hypothetical protein
MEKTGLTGCYTKKKEQRIRSKRTFNRFFVARIFFTELT